MRPTATTIDLPPLSIRADIRSVDPEARTVDVCFSTGAPVTRYDWVSGKRYVEQLSMKPAHVRLERLNAVGSLLDTHSAFSVADIFGAVVPGSARLEGGLGLAKVKFSKRDAVEPYWQDVVDGIIRALSAGYKVHTYQETTGRDNALPTRLAIDWEPYEISLVPMPADAGATVRQDRSLLHRCTVIHVVADADRRRRLQLAKARN
jgi:hypothetical protein